MKKFFKSAMLFAAAAMAFTSCSNDDEMNVQPAEQKIDVTVNANIEADTRAEFEGGNGGQFAWVAGDQIVMKYQVPFYERATLNFDGTSFTGTLSNTPKEGKPVEAVALSDVEGSADEFAIKSVQTNKWNGTYNNIANVPFISEPLVFNAGMGNKEKLNMTLNFRHMAAYMQIRFVSDVCAGDAVKSVTFADVNNADVAGQIEIDKTAGNKMFSDFVTITPKDVTYTMKKASKVVTLNFQEGGQPTIAATSAQADYNKVAYLMVKPGEYTPKMVVETVGGKKFNIEMTKAKNFVRGNVARIKLNLSADRMEGGVTPEPEPEPGTGIDPNVYNLVNAENAASLLVGGSEVVIVRFPEHKDYNKTFTEAAASMGYYRGCANLKESLYTKTADGKIVIDPANLGDIHTFTLVKNGANFHFMRGAGYLQENYASYGHQYLGVSDSKNASNENTFAIEVLSGVKAGYCIVKTISNYYIDLKAVQATTSAAEVAIFAKPGQGGTTPDPEPQPEVKPIVLTTTPANGETITFAQDAASEQTIVVTIEGGDSSKTYTYEAALSGVNADKFAVNGDKVSTIGANETTTAYEAVLTITVMENGVATETTATINLKQEPKATTPDPTPTPGAGYRAITTLKELDSATEVLLVSGTNVVSHQAGGVNVTVGTATINNGVIATAPERSALKVYKSGSQYNFVFIDNDKAFRGTFNGNVTTAGYAGYPTTINWACWTVDLDGAGNARVINANSANCGGLKLVSGQWMAPFKNKTEYSVQIYAK